MNDSSLGDGILLSMENLRSSSDGHFAPRKNDSLRGDNSGYDTGACARAVYVYLIALI